MTADLAWILSGLLLTLTETQDRTDHLAGLVMIALGTCLLIV